MKLFVVTSHNSAQGGWFVGAYSTKAKADDAIAQLETKQKEAGYHSGVWWEVEEVDLDGPPNFDA